MMHQSRLDRVGKASGRPLKPREVCDHIFDGVCEVGSN